MSEQGKRFDFLISVLPQEEEPMLRFEEQACLQHEIGKFLREHGYEKFVVASSDMISEASKKKMDTIYALQAMIEEAEKENEILNEYGHITTESYELFKRLIDKLKEN